MAYIPPYAANDPHGLGGLLMAQGGVVNPEVHWAEAMKLADIPGSGIIDIESAEIYARLRASGLDQRAALSEIDTIFRLQSDAQRVPALAAPFLDREGPELGAPPAGPSVGQIPLPADMIEPGASALAPTPIRRGQWAETLPINVSETLQEPPLGRPTYTIDGQRMSERSITVTDPRINNGAPTNIPTLFGGKIVSDEEAIQRVADAGGMDPLTGRNLQAYASIQEAGEAAAARSAQLGRELARQASVGDYDLGELEGASPDRGMVANLLMGGPAGDYQPEDFTDTGIRAREPIPVDDSQEQMISSVMAERLQQRVPKPGPTPESAFIDPYDEVVPEMGGNELLDDVIRYQRQRQGEIREGIVPPQVEPPIDYEPGDTEGAELAMALRGGLAPDVEQGEGLDEQERVANERQAALERAALLQERMPQPPATPEGAFIDPYEEPGPVAAWLDPAVRELDPDYGEAAATPVDVHVAGPEQGDGAGAIPGAAEEPVKAAIMQADRKEFNANRPPLKASLSAEKYTALMQLVKQARANPQRQSDIVTAILSDPKAPRALRDEMFGIAMTQYLQKPKESPSSVREYQFALANGYKGNYMEFLADKKPKAGDTVITFSDQSKQHFAERVGEGYWKIYEENLARAQESYASLRENEEARRLVRSMYTGSFAEAALVISKVLNAAGIADTGNAIQNTEAFMAMRVRAVGKIIKLFGSGTGLSDADREFAALGAAAKITLNAASIRKILADGDTVARHWIGVHNDHVADAYKVYPEVPEGALRLIETELPQSGRMPEEGEVKTITFEEIAGGEYTPAEYIAGDPYEPSSWRVIAKGDRRWAAWREGLEEDIRAGKAPKQIYNPDTKLWTAVQPEVLTNKELRANWDAFDDAIRAEFGNDFGKYKARGGLF
jgi:hypothetical protein